MSVKHEKPICRDKYDEVIKSTRMLYGQDPHIYGKKNVTENTLIIPKDGSVRYLI